MFKVSAERSEMGQPVVLLVISEHWTVRMKMKVDELVGSWSTLDTGDLVTGDPPELNMAWQHPDLCLQLSSLLVYRGFVWCTEHQHFNPFSGASETRLRLFQLLNKPSFCFKGWSLDIWIVRPGEGKLTLLCSVAVKTKFWFCFVFPVACQTLAVQGGKKSPRWVPLWKQGFSLLPLEYLVLVWETG